MKIVEIVLLIVAAVTLVTMFTRYLTAIREDMNQILIKVDELDRFASGLAARIDGQSDLTAGHTYQIGEIERDISALISQCQRFKGYIYRIDPEARDV